MRRGVWLALSAALMAGALLTAAAGNVSAAVSKTINYQAVLLSGGNPQTTPVSAVFTIYDAPIGGNALWTETRTVSPDGAGRVSMRLGENTPLDETVFAGEDRWLGVKIAADAEMSPRTALASAPYSFRVETIDQAKAGEVAGELVLRSDGSALRAKDAMDNEWMRAENKPGEGGVLSIRGQGGGYTQHSALASTYYSSTKADAKKFEIGQAGTVLFGSTEDDTLAQLRADGSMRVTGSFGVDMATAIKGPGENNVAMGTNLDHSQAEYSFLFGDADTLRSRYGFTLGIGNVIGDLNVGFALGYQNYLADGAHRSMTLGDSNYVEDQDNICIGRHHQILESFRSAILSGGENVIEKASDDVVIGGVHHRISGSSFSVIAGGERNRIDSTDNNNNRFNDATISGGADNIASEFATTVGGGIYNEARGLMATVGGGSTNKATSRQTTVAGGIVNEATGEVATVGGGESNLAAGSFSTVPGGFDNEARGYASFAAGHRARAVHDGSYVWADAQQDSFKTTAANQFLIRASGGVGIGVNNPSTALEVSGTVDADAFTINGTPVGTSTSSYWNQNGTNIYYNSGSVGIGTSTPSEELEVSGDIKATGTITSGNSITIDGVNDKITATSGTIDFDNENLITEGTATFGPGHSVSGDNAFVAGTSNTVTAVGDYSTIGGGSHNVANASMSTIGGGSYNTTEANTSTIGGGYSNLAAGAATVGGGAYNHARGNWSVIAGGGGPNEADSNSASGACSFIGGGRGNTASGDSSNVLGGSANSAVHLLSTVAGGRNNYNAGPYGFIGGGVSDSIHYPLGNIGSFGTFIAGGINNVVDTGNGFVTGANNRIRKAYLCAIAGGTQNLIDGEPILDGLRGCFIAGSVNRIAPNEQGGEQNSICGGYLNSIEGPSSQAVVSGGYQNHIEGAYSAIPGGIKDTVIGDYGFAFGNVVYAGAYQTAFYDGAHSGQVGINRDGRDGISYPLHIGTTTANGNGARLTAGGTWTNGSSRTFKENFTSVDAQALLSAIAAMSIESWNYIGTTERHIGPVAEDFVAAFDVGATTDNGTRDNKYLAAGDVAGVALVAVQALYKQNQDQQKEIAELKALLERLLAERR